MLANLLLDAVHVYNSTSVCLSVCVLIISTCSRQVLKRHTHLHIRNSMSNVQFLLVSMYYVYSTTISICARVFKCVLMSGYYLYTCTCTSSHSCAVYGVGQPGQGMRPGGYPNPMGNPMAGPPGMQRKPSYPLPIPP